MGVRVDASQEYGLVNTACIAQHEWYAALRSAGFTRSEGLYIITRPSVESSRLEWLAMHPDSQAT